MPLRYCQRKATLTFCHTENATLIFCHTENATLTFCHTENATLTFCHTENATLTLPLLVLFCALLIEAFTGIMNHHRDQQSIMIPSSLQYIYTIGQNGSHTHTMWHMTYAAIMSTQYTLLKTFKGSDFQSHIFRNILGKVLPDCSPV